MFALEWFSIEAFIILVVLYKVLDWLLRRFYIGRYSERYILVTGCDTGFGHLLAKRLDALGCHVFAGCLTERGETELKKACSNRLQALSLDVSKPDSVRSAYKIVKQELPQGKGLWGVMNNAGIFGLVGPLEWLTLDDYKDVAAVNLYGMIDVTMTFLPLLKAARGRVVNTSSVAGRLSFPICCPYNISKYGVEAFSDALRRSLYAFNVKVAIIEPGGFRTAFASPKNVTGALTKAWNQATEEVKAEYGEDYLKNNSVEIMNNLIKIHSSRFEDVVDAYEHALLGRFPRARYVVGVDAKYVILPLTALPEWLSDWLFAQTNPGQPAALLK